MLFRSAFSSTHRELIAIEHSLKAFGPILRNSRAKWFLDSQSSIRIVEVGSMQFSLPDDQTQLTYEMIPGFKPFT